MEVRHFDGSAADSAGAGVAVALAVFAGAAAGAAAGLIGAGGVGCGDWSQAAIEAERSTSDEARRGCMGP